MLDSVCKFLRTIGCANKLLHILSALRITVFAAAVIYSGVMFVSLVRQNIRNI